MKEKIVNISGERITIPIPTSYGDCFTLINSDQFRLTGVKLTKLRLFFNNIKPFQSSVLFWLRLSQYKGWLFPLCRYMYKRASRRYQIHIPSSTIIGYGFYIGHGICITINGQTIIGNNVNVSQFMNIGTNKKTPAKIGNSVYIGPNTCLVEDVIIGSNSTIGAGSIVTKDVPANATVVGSPARVLNYDDPAQYIKNPWIAKLN